jgi:hypothetical protein
MKPFLYSLALIGLTAGSAPASSMIEKACLKAGRDAASRDLCGCIQNVADQSLQRKDQRLAASFFKDPHKAQVIRQSERPNNKVFWVRYKAWSAAASEICTPLGES